MKFKNSLSKANSHLILAGVFSLTLGACSGGGSGTVADPGTNPVTPPVGTIGSPQIVGSIDLPDDGSGVHVAGNYAYVAADSSGLQVIDVSSKLTPVIAGQDTSIFAKGGVQFISVSIGDFLYMSGGFDGLHIMDVSDPTSPFSAAASFTVSGGDFSDVSISPSGGTLCSAAGMAGIRIYYGLNGSKSVPTPVAFDRAVGIVKSGDYCFATTIPGTFSGSASLHVIDVSNPDTATIVKSLTLNGSPSGIAIVGDYAYIAAGDPGMYVIDISTPTNPQVVGQTTAFSATGPIAVDATRMRAYLGTTDTVGFPEDGLKIIDISNAASPAIIATADLPNWTGGVAALDGFVYATTYDLGGSATSQFHIVDVSAF